MSTVETAKKVENKICWFEISTSNPERSQAFYRGLFGWDFGQEIGDWEYREIKPPDGSVGGGLVKRDNLEPANGSVVLYTEVANLKESTERAVQLGGQLHREASFLSESAGSYALVKDTDGNVIGLWSREGMTE